jgi:hypothetical protein
MLRFLYANKVGGVKMRTILLAFVIQMMIFLIGCNEDDKSTINFLFKNISSKNVDSLIIGFYVSDTSDIYSATTLGNIKTNSEYSYDWEPNYPWYEGGYQLNVYFDDSDILIEKFGYFTGKSDYIDSYTIEIRDTSITIAP